MRIFSHTCSNTEIVCALGCGAALIGVDQDSDYPPEVVAALPKPGRDLDLDVHAVIALKPDLVLSSLTVPGHERIVEALQSSGVRVEVSDPQSLEDVYADIRRIAQALGAQERGEQLVAQMRAAMPPMPRSPDAPKVLLEWWPKPVIAPARDSWATDLIELAGGVNPWGGHAAKSVSLDDAQIRAAAPDIVVMSWCGVPLKNYRSEVVTRREGWDAVPAVKNSRVVPITEAFLGRPGPRLMEGYRALRACIEAYILAQSLSSTTR